MRRNGVLRLGLGRPAGRGWSGLIGGAASSARWAIALALVLSLTLLAGCGGDGDDGDDANADGGGQTAKNVILLIGDGMGPAHRTAARLNALGRGGELAMDRLPQTGVARNWSTESIVTDSAAAATALATGVKTYNKAIGVGPDKQPVPTILEKAQEAGKAVGLVTNVWLSHATPASFAAHNPERDDYLAITLDMFNHNVDVMLGGGEDYFLPSGTPGCYPDDGDRTDRRDIVQEAVAGGYKHVCTEADFAAVDAAATDKLLGTFADYNMARPYTPSLAAMTEKALAVLSKDPDGFFLMVEGGQIDQAAHGNDAANTLGDVLTFDEAVEVAVAFQAQHPDTLVIVTADHATGGLTIDALPEDGPCPEPSPDNAKECRTGGQEDGPFAESGGGTFWIDWSSSTHTPATHTADDVPVMAIGPGAAALVGEYENTHVFEAMRAALGLPE